MVDSNPNPERDPAETAREAVKKAQKARAKQLRNTEAYKKVVTDPRNANIDEVALDRSAIRHAIAEEQREKEARRQEEEKCNKRADLKKKIKIGAGAVAGTLVLAWGMTYCGDNKSEKKDTITGVDSDSIDKSRVTSPNNDAICHNAEQQIGSVIDEAEITTDSRKKENLANTASLMLDFDIENGCLSPEEEQRIESEVNRLQGGN